MRLPLSKVWRAFPELDRFSDEQCQRFVRAARRGAGRPIRVVATAAALLAGWAGGLAFIVWMTAGRKPIFRAWDSPTTLGTLALCGVMILVFLVAAAPAILVRDRLLRRRVMRIITLRGRCMMCKYSLLGLPVGANLLVVCPECGAPTPVDPALGELVSDEAGQARFQPRPEQFPEYRAFFTPERVRTITRWSLRVFVAVFILTGGALVYHELRIRADARQAAADRAGPDGIEVFVAALAKQAEGEKVNGWTVMVEAYSEARAAEGNVLKRLAGNDPGASADPTMVFEDIQRISVDRQQAAERDRRLGMALVEQARTTGLFDRLDRAASAGLAVRPLVHDPELPAARMAVPELGYVRYLARLNAARLHVACNAQDAADAERALATGLMLGRLTGQQPLLIDKLVGQAVESLALDVARKCVLRQPGEATLAGLQRALDAQPPPDDRRDLLRGEEVFLRDTIRWYYTDPSRVRWGWFSAKLPLTLMLGQTALPGRVPYYEATVNDLSAACSQATVALLAPPPVSAAPLPRAGVWGNALVENLGSVNQLSLRQNLDTHDFQRSGLVALIAVERYRAAHGVPPPSLAALVPTYLATVPVDPFSGLPLGYMVIKPAAEDTRTYLLFGTGLDGKYDLPTAANRGAAMTAHPLACSPAAGRDAVVNTLAE